MNRFPISIILFAQLLAASASAQNTYESYYFTTIAGLDSVPGSADGTGAHARFNSPGRLSVDAQGNVFIADSGNHSIRKVTPQGQVTTLAGSPGQQGTNDGVGSHARFSQPFGTAPDAQGNIYVADYENHTIRKITPTLQVTTVAGQPGAPAVIDGTGPNARFNGPVGITVHSSGDILITDRKGHAIRRMTPAGQVTTIAGSIEGSLDGPALTAQFNAPSGIAEDPAGNLYIADQINHTIRKMTPAGVVTTLAGSPRTLGSVDATGSAARFFFPTSLGVDRQGNIFVADNSNRLIRKVTPAGVVTTLGGRNHEVGAVDGQGWEALFFGPTGIAVDARGDLYICDYFNHTLRKGSAFYISPITPPPAITNANFTFHYSSTGLEPTIIEASSDLVQWTPIATNAPADYAPFQEPANTTSNRFYRLRAP